MSFKQVFRRKPFLRLLPAPRPPGACHFMRTVTEFFLLPPCLFNQSVTACLSLYILHVHEHVYPRPRRPSQLPWNKEKKTEYSFGTAIASRVSEATERPTLELRHLSVSVNPANEFWYKNWHNTLAARGSVRRPPTPCRCQSILRRPDQRGTGQRYSQNCRGELHRFALVHLREVF